MHIDVTIQPGFKDKIPTVDYKGKRKWLYVFQPKGKLYRMRSLFSLIYLAAFFTFPFIKVDGNPFFLLDLTKAKFILFGKVFLPQDFILFGIGMLVFLLFVIVFTLAFGRVFCGWACPQTIFMEMVFRKIEYWIEGDANKQRLQARNTWTTEMYLRKTLKHIAFFLFSFLIANTFLSYIIGLDALKAIVTGNISDHLVGFISLLFFTTVFYLVYAFVREIVCTVICPYGRLQSVLLDKNSISVAYDYLRGEPRGKRKKQALETAGDCIDCNMCVNVCPTGIDIRNGTQMECINCTACIDACNKMMEAVQKPLHLIKYASENNIATGAKSRFTYRIKAYSAVLVVLAGILVTLLVTRTMFDATVLRVPGQILQENSDGTISNLYRIKIVNKSNRKQPYHLQVMDGDAHIEFVGQALDSLAPIAETEETFFIKIPVGKIAQRKQQLRMQILSGKDIIQTKNVPFIGTY